MRAFMGWLGSGRRLTQTGRIDSRTQSRLLSSHASGILRSQAFVYSNAYTQRVAKQIPVREFRSRLSELLNDVADRRDHILVTRYGKPAAALVPIDEYQALEETAEILSDPDAIAAIEAGLADLNRGDTVTLDALRAELAERRRTL